MHRYGLIGETLSYSYSKLIHEFIAKEEGIDLTYELIEIEDLSEFNFDVFDGFNVTIPYKTEIMDYLSYIDETAQALGCVNTVNFDRKGFNTDIVGFKYLVDKLDLDDVETMVVLGGGAMAQMIKNYYTDINIIIVSRQDAAYNYDNLGKIKGDILINTTPTTMAGDYMNLIVPEEFIASFAGVIDLNYNPGINHFLNIAARNFIPYTNGLDMLLVQAIAAFEILNECQVDASVLDKLRHYIINMTSPNIALIGFSASGKSTYIKEHDGIDLDDEIEKIVGMSCKNFIQVMGIEEFRRVEKATLADLVGQDKHLIALGGGAVEDFDNQLLLHKYQILDMTQPLDIIKDRLKDKNDRPLITNTDELNALYERRLKYYEYFKTGDFDENFNH